MHRRFAGELLIDVQRHHGMNFPNCVFLWFSSSVGTIRRRVIDIEKGHACDRDYVLLAEFEPLGCFETERKALRRPAKNKLPKLTPLGADGNFGTNTSRFLPVGIFEHESNVTVCFDFTLTRRPVRLYHFCSAGILVSVSGVKGTFGSGPFHS